jgi:hypothetical protein
MVRIPNIGDEKRVCEESQDGGRRIYAFTAGVLTFSRSPIVNITVKSKSLVFFFGIQVATVAN